MNTITYTYNLLLGVVLLPLGLLAFVALLPEKQEKWIGKSVKAGISLLITGIMLTAAMAWQHMPLHTPALTLYANEHLSFALMLFLDKLSLVFLFVGGILIYTIAHYSVRYMHREPGYRRFFATFALFVFGYNTAVLAGTFETLMIGWEFLGLTSFLLISFYRLRFLPVRNAFKVFMLYRIGDVALLIGIWLAHQCFHTSSFAAWQQHVSPALAGQATMLLLLMGICFLVAAGVKSAQFPFTYWLPRAMEGPTPSSAIFYGALAVHIGAFLLMRTFPLWQSVKEVRVAIGAVGLLTAVVASLIARVQPSIKGKIAYSAAAQLGLIFIEVAAGWIDLALWHFAGNAFLRSYQLLVSPSKVALKIREQLYHFEPVVSKKIPYSKRRRLYSWYVWALKECNMEIGVYRLIWKPFKVIGSRVPIHSLSLLWSVGLPVLLMGTYLRYLPSAAAWHSLLSSAFGIMGLLLIMRAYAERQKPELIWHLVFFNQWFTLLAVSYHAVLTSRDVILYASGMLPSFLLGAVILRLIGAEMPYFHLHHHQGYIAWRPKTAFIFLLSALGMAGFPISPSFIGLDLLFSSVQPGYFILVFSMSSGFILGGISLIRLYTKLFLGPLPCFDRPKPLFAS
jgi:formate hydrogenlyase subunit 3/multisubunit Na+/H+ antiporter MnhD subunit